MKSNDIGRKVKVTKSGTFNGLEGEIVEIKATVRFAHLGEWSFSYSDLALTGSTEKANEPKISPVKELSNESEAQVSTKEKSLLKTVKTPKVKTIKTEKRKYTKKVK